MTAATADTARTGAVDLAPIAALSDPLGVVSVYVDADPALPRAAWHAPVRAGLRGLQSEARELRSRAKRVALTARLAELGDELDALLDPDVAGRGRALFAPVGGGDLHRIVVRAPFTPLVGLGPTARILPLVAAAQASRPAGVAIVSWAGLELAEWEFDRLRRLKTFELPEPQAPRSRPATNPAVPQSFPERDRFESAVAARTTSALCAAAAQVAGEPWAERGWDMLVVDGDPRLVSLVSDPLVSGAYRLVQSPRPLAGVPVAAAAARIGPIVREERARRDAELLRTLQASPASALDPLVVARSLDEGRVEHLLLAAPGQGADAGRSESLLRLALETGAGVTVFPSGAAELGAGGVGALLRW
jgi:hypothetical protein